MSAGRVGSQSHVRVRLFLTCWLIFALHFATDFVREHYLVLSMVEDHSFRLDPYVGLHPDIFVTPGRGAHHNANPGASMIAAIPYAVVQPLVHRVAPKLGGGVHKPAGAEESVYDDRRGARVRFYRQVRERGLDVKFGLVGVVTAVLCMAPLASASAVVMFEVLKFIGIPALGSLVLSFVYAFGTPVFFRSAYLNQNLLVGIFGFMAFALVWMRSYERPNGVRTQVYAGLLCGLAVLCDYSGMVLLVLVGAYAAWIELQRASMRSTLRTLAWYAAGALVPLAALWWYQWSAFGSLFYPPQHFMAPQLYSDAGYRGVAGPSAELFWMLLFDPGFGLFVAAPLLLLAVLTPIFAIRNTSVVPSREMWFIGLVTAALIGFFSTVEYTRLQWVTGIRYLIPVVPFLFLLVAAVLVRLPKQLSITLSVLAIAQSWAMAMARRVGDPGDRVVDSLISVLRDGPQLPWLATLGRMGTRYFQAFDVRSVSAVPIFVVAGLAIYGVWRVSLPAESIGKPGKIVVPQSARS